MNLQPILRAAVCAALVVVCVAGAEWFPIQPVAAQETKQQLRQWAAADGSKLSENIPSESVAAGYPAKDQQIYRPGLRNSFLEPRLSANELNVVLTQLRHKTGFTQMRFDEAGFLIIDDRTQFVGGSALARELVLAAIDGNKSINLQSHNRSPKVVFGRVTARTKYAGRKSSERIEVIPVEIDFTDFNHLRGEKKALEAFDPGFVILHELCHAALELRDSVDGDNAAGDCENYVNRIRRELGMPERQQYEASSYLKSPSLTLPTATIARLVFTQTKPGREPESRPKKRTLHLRWDVQQVGNNR